MSRSSSRMGKMPDPMRKRKPYTAAAHIIFPFQNKRQRLLASSSSRKSFPSPNASTTAAIPNTCIHSPTHIQSFFFSHLSHQDFILNRPDLSFFPVTTHSFHTPSSYTLFIHPCLPSPTSTIMTAVPRWTDEAVAALLFIFRTCRTAKMDPMGRPLRIRGWEFIRKMLKVLGHKHSLFAIQYVSMELKYLFGFLPPPLLVPFPPHNPPPMVRSGRTEG
ncbi:hypothetical protein F4809DRAFT_605053 [Biscogniauxia mediterranea]|nr:hypothetical protein F4809DRAFT_605053 [Biscogniauxia mediterranea]